MSSNEKEILISTKAFDAFQLNHEIKIIEKNRAYRSVALIMILVGILCIPFSLLMEANPIKKTIVAILEYALWYGGIVVLVAGIIYLLISLNLFKARQVLFDIQKSELQIRGRSIAFSEIKNLRCVEHRLLGQNVVKIRFHNNGLPSPLILAPIVNPENPEEIKSFVEKLNAIISGGD